MQGNIDFTGTLSGAISDSGGGGSDVTITPTLQSGTKIADFTIDSESGSLYAPTPEEITVSSPLSKSGDNISIDLSNYITSSSLETILEDYPTYQYTESRYTPLATFNAYTISAESHFQRTLTAGANITIDPVTDTISASGGGEINYSTSEQDTGVLWFDGRHIYQKTIEISVTSSNTFSYDLSALNIDIIIDNNFIYLFADATHNYQVPVYYGNSQDFINWFLQDKSTLIIRKPNNIANGTAYVTFKYVKVVTSTE